MNEVSHSSTLSFPNIGMTIPKQEPDCSENEVSFSGDDLPTALLPFTAPYKIRDPEIVLERCDKIWEELKLAKDKQSTENDSNDKNAETVKTSVQDESQKETFVNGELSNKLQSNGSYIRYQPELSNGNSALPNFKLCVASRKNVYSCTECSKQYSKRIHLKHHAEKKHGVILSPSKKNRVNEGYISNIKTRRSKLLKENGLLENNSSVNISSENIMEAMLEERLTKQNQMSQRTNFHVPQKEKNIPTQTAHMKKLEKERSDNILSKHEPYRHNPALKERYSSIPDLQCLLCNKYVSSMKEHLTICHNVTRQHIISKLEARPATKATEANDITAKTVQASNVGAINTNSALKNEIALNRSSVLAGRSQSKKRSADNLAIDFIKRQKVQGDNASANNSETSANFSIQSVIYSCDICHKDYSYASSYKRHIRMHKKYGEKQPNSLFTEWQSSLPLRLKRTSLKDAGKNNDDVSTAANFTSVDSSNQDSMDDGTDTSACTERRSKKEMHRACVCGRSFRNPYTMFIHKRNCQAIGEAEQTEDRRRSNDRDSGIGINITIKKKNNSYEIVGKSGTKRKSSDRLSHYSDSTFTSEVTSNDSNIHIDDESGEVGEYFKYSKDHNIVRLKKFDEDIDIDIETDLEDSYGSANSDKKFSEVPKLKEKETSSLQVNVEKMKKRVSIADDLVHTGNESRTIQSVPTLVTLCKAAVKQNSLKRLNVENPEKGTKICERAKEGCKTRSADKHREKENESKALDCGYCKELFNNCAGFQNHFCTVDVGKLPLTKEIYKCYDCDDMFASLSVFDRHQRTVHSDIALSCFQCKEKFPSRNQRDNHYRLKHVNIICDICEIEVPYSLKVNHIGYHRGEGYPCHRCKRTYRNSESRTMHLRFTHRDHIDRVTRVTCKICFQMLKHNVHIRHTHSNGTCTQNAIDPEEK